METRYYYAGQIVNHQHRTNDIPIAKKATKIGRTRFAAAEPRHGIKVDFRINPTDIMKRRTVYFGMSRSGKSNGLKIVAESIYRLRQDNPEHRIGQIIFDLSGEYAQDNYQDGKGLHRVHETIGSQREHEVATYGLLSVPWDADRKVMKLNFFGDPIPKRWETDQETKRVEQALDQMLAGKEIIKGIMANESARYTTAFRDVDLAVEPNCAGDMGAHDPLLPGHHSRLPDRIVRRWPAATELAAFHPRPGRSSLFSKALIDAMKAPNKTNRRIIKQTTIKRQSSCESARQNQFTITWDQLVTVLQRSPTSW